MRRKANSLIFDLMYAQLNTSHISGLKLNPVKSPLFYLGLWRNRNTL